MTAHVPSALQGIRVIELAGVGPVPFAGMVLADLGAQVMRIERPAGTDPYAGAPGAGGPLGRGRRSLSVDLRSHEGADLVLTLASSVDVFLEGLRPGVTERLGIGPDVLREANPRLVYGRMTGYGQTGPLCREAGHDLTYLAYSGVLGGIGPRDGVPVPPLNLVADFGGGAMSLVAGVLAALVERGTSGRGQVVDVAMTDAAAYLATMTRHMRAAGAWHDQRGVNLLDGGAPHYRCYETKDGRYVAVGALEPAFWQQLVSALELSDAGLPSPYDEASWPELTSRLTAVFRSRTRDEWVAATRGTDACLAPVLDWDEAPAHPHHRERDAFAESAGVLVARPPIRLSRTPATVASDDGAGPAELLAAHGVESGRVAALLERGVVGPAGT